MEERDDIPRHHLGDCVSGHARAVRLEDTV